MVRVLSCGCRGEPSGVAEFREKSAELQNNTNFIVLNQLVSILSD
jgi:hypothetical protein